MTAAGLAADIGITAKAVEKYLAKLKAEGIIEREGPKGGSWNISSESIISFGETVMPNGLIDMVVK